MQDGLVTQSINLFEEESLPPMKVVLSPLRNLALVYFQNAIFDRPSHTGDTVIDVKK